MLLRLLNKRDSPIKPSFLLLVILTTTFSCSDILEVPDISNQQITILAPLEGSTITANSVNFNWDSLEDIDNYHLQVATPGFDNANQFVLGQSVCQRQVWGLSPIA